MASDMLLETFLENGLRAFKVCPKCKLNHSLSNYHKCNLSSGKKKYLSWCKDCYRENNRKRSRMNSLKFIHGLSLEDFQRMSENQENLCLICKEFKPLCVDHDHKTGRIRGLICASCNKGLGHFRDNVEFMQRAIDYVK